MTKPDVFAWVEALDPKTIPYRPGAGRSGDSFGFRESFSGEESPLHLATDRKHLPDVLLHPFGGPFIWRKLPDGYDWGSLLRISTLESVLIEIQVAHTQPENGFSVKNGTAAKGEHLAGIHVGSLGMTFGPHTHTEVLIEDSEENRFYLRELDEPWLWEGKIENDQVVVDHCRAHGFDVEAFRRRLVRQISSWNIREAGRTYAIRTLPSYRVAHWGESSVILIDSARYLEI